MIVGIDEAGRGCWAGPLYAAAVVLRDPIEGITDSKKLSALRRAQIAGEIKATASYGVGFVSPAEIDDIGLTLATQKAMQLAFDQLKIEHAEIIIDGNFNYLPHLSNTSTLVRGDALVPAIGAASILAKVARDEYMLQIAEKYPQYQFERHVGYGTALHHHMLKKYGPCDIHRLSYKPLQALLKVSDV